MIRQLTQVLNSAELQAIIELLQNVAWQPGSDTAGAQAKGQKNNEQLAHDSPPMQQIRSCVLAALDRHTDFFATTLPRQIYPPRVNRYTGVTNHFGAHVDNTIRFNPVNQARMRTDISCTLFLADAASYGGGELVFHASVGEVAVKLAAGDAVIYPSGTLHEVMPVTYGERIACFFWIESMVRDHAQRELLVKLDQTIRALRTQHGETAEAIALTGTYHNLLQMWAHA